MKKTQFSLIFSFLAFTGIAMAADMAPVEWTVVDDAGQISTASASHSAVVRQKAMENEVLERTAEDISANGIINKDYVESMVADSVGQERGFFVAGKAKSLDDLIDRAKGVHTRTKAAEEGISLAKRRMIYAFRQLLPEVEYEYNYRDGHLTGGAFTSRGAKLSIRQPIFRGGILWNTFLQERKMLDASEKEYNKVLDELIHDLSLAYFEYQRAKSAVDDYHATIGRIAQYADISQQKYDMEIISEIENLNVQSLFSQLEFDMETAKQELELAKLDLQKLLSLSVRDDIDIDAVFDIDTIISESSAEKIDDIRDIEMILSPMEGGKPVPGLEELVDMSYGNRAELHVEISELEAARLDEKIRWGGLLPRGDLVVDFGKLGESFTDIPGPMLDDGSFAGTDDPKGRNEFRLMLEMNWNAGGNKVGYTYERDERAPSVTQFQSGRGSLTKRNTLTVGVLDGLNTFVDVKQAEVDKLNAVIQLEEAEKKVLSDVKSAYFDYQKSLIQLKSTIQRVEWRRRLRDLADHRMGTKEVEISEYVQSESDLMEERSKLFTALKDYYSAKASLNYAVGVKEFLNVEG